MTAYRHTWRTVAPEYARGGIGLALTAGPLAAAPLAPAVAWTLAALALPFALHLVRTALRQAAAIACDAEAIALSGPFARRIAWRELRAMRLRYFTVRRTWDRSAKQSGQGAGGWMQLVLRGPRGSIRIESTLPGFADIVSRAAEAASAQGIDLAPATLDNLGMLGLSPKISRQSVVSHAGSFERQRS